MTRVRFVSADGSRVSEVDAADFEKLPRATEEEEDLLDLASHVTRHSRLACQVILADELEELTVRIPGGSRNMQGR